MKKAMIKDFVLMPVVYHVSPAVVKGNCFRHQSRDDIFKAGNNLQTGSVEMCHTGWGKTQISPEELEERVEKIEIRYWFNEKDIEDINKYKFKLD